ncbi:MAG: hypothetical protein WCI61_05630 [Chloroflexota bacterium]
MSTTATLPARTAPPEEECRRCRAARSIGRIALFILGGLASSFAISWVTARYPSVGIVLSVLGVLLLARSLVRLFSTTSPMQAATQIGISLGIGAAVSGLVTLIATVAAR